MTTSVVERKLSDYRSSFNKPISTGQDQQLHGNSPDPHRKDWCTHDAGFIAMPGSETPISPATPMHGVDISVLDQNRDRPPRYLRRPA